MIVRNELKAGAGSIAQKDNKACRCDRIGGPDFVLYTEDKINQWLSVPFVLPGMRRRFLQL